MLMADVCRHHSLLESSSTGQTLPSECNPPFLDRCVSNIVVFSIVVFGGLVVVVVVLFVIAIVFVVDIVLDIDIVIVIFMSFLNHFSNDHLLLGPA